MIHYFETKIDDIELPQLFTYPFCYTPHTLSEIASKELQEYISRHDEWSNELSHGKMFGVLVVKNRENDKIGYIAAFSGTLDGSNNQSFFVPPIYDMLQEDGYFKAEEQAISAINQQISILETESNYTSKIEKLSKIKKQGDETIKRLKHELKLSKKRRDQLRKSSQLKEEELSNLIKESQFEKAELKRTEHKIREDIAICKEELALYKSEIKTLKTKRKNLSSNLQQWLFSQFIIKNSIGDSTDLNRLFATTSQKVAPAGAGECAAPKLLQYAYNNNLQPISMAEFWWGESPKGEVRHHGNFYPACRGKCLPILTFMLKGLDVEPNPLLDSNKTNQDIPIIYQDEHLIIVNKPEGVLSVPGKDNINSIYDILKQNFPYLEDLFMCHRLDMSTSGLLIAAKSKEVYEKMQRKFENREVKKRYTALLDGIVENKHGHIRLPLISDYLDRPRQKIDFKNGKVSITRYEVINIESLTINKTTIKATRIAFYPVTGRTHQLRLHSSHKLGLNSPIIGDRLYGKGASRLFLHADELIFSHPITKKELKISIPTPF